MPVWRRGAQDIRYEVRGRGSPLFLVHSLGTAGSLWDELADRLAGRHRVVTPDLRGHGGSPRGGPVTMAEMAADLADLARGTGLEPAFWLGISLGGVVVQEVYRRRPEAVRGLILACTFAHVDPEVARRRVEERRAFLADHSLEEFARRYVDQTLLPGTPAPRRELVRRAMSAMDREAYLEAAAAVFAADTRDVLPAIAVPTLVLGAERDAGYPPEQIRALAARIPGASVEIIPDAGHLAHLDNPEAFAAAVLAFLARVEGAATAEGVGGSAAWAGRAQGAAAAQDAEQGV